MNDSRDTFGVFLDKSIVAEMDHDSFHLGKTRYYLQPEGKAIVALYPSLSSLPLSLCHIFDRSNQTR